MQLTGKDGDCNGCGKNNGKLYECPGCEFVAYVMCLFVCHPSDNVSHDGLTEEVMKIVGSASGAKVENLADSKYQNWSGPTKC